MSMLVYKIFIQKNVQDCGYLYKFIISLLNIWKYNYEIIIFDDKINEKHINNYDVNNRSVLILCDTVEDKILSNVLDNVFGKILLFGITKKIYNSKVANEFGVAGIRPYDNKKPLTDIVVFEDPSTKGLPQRIQLRKIGDEKVGVLIPDGASALLFDLQGNPFLTRYNNRYVISIPAWQMGVPSFPAIFTILRNLLIFSNDIGHFSPTPYVSLRIDDFPLSSEQYLKSGGVSDESRCSEIKTLCDWSSKYGAKLEFMVNSHLITREGKHESIDAFVPKSAAMLRDYFRNGVVNLNSHGRSHIDEEQYISTGQVSPLEFANLDEERTKEHLRDNIDFMKNYFGKTPTGFVPPCWSYRECLTKKVCAEYFSFIIDSDDHARNREDCPPLGHLDANSLLHLNETWHLGGADLEWQDSATWRSFLDCGIPLHMMVHGLYLRDPVPFRSIPKTLTLTAFALLLPFLVFAYWSEILRMVRGAGGGITWDRLGLLRKILVRLPWFADASVETLLKKGNEIGAEWVFTEDLADHLRWYSGLEVLEYRRTSDLHQITFNLKCEARGRFLFHLPHPSLEAELDGQPLSQEIGDRTLTLANLAAGHHLLMVKVQ